MCKKTEKSIDKINQRWYYRTRRKYTYKNIKKKDIKSYVKNKVENIN